MIEGAAVAAATGPGDCHWRHTAWIAGTVRTIAGDMRSEGKLMRIMRMLFMVLRMPFAVFQSPGITWIERLIAMRALTGNIHLAMLAAFQL